MQIRVCSNFPGVSYDSRGYASALASPLGAIAPVRIGFDFLSRNNISLIYYSLLHHKNRHHGSCLNALIHDDADITTETLPIDVVADHSDRLIPGPPSSQYDASFITMFKTRRVTRSPDVLDFVADVPISVIVSVMLTMMLLVILTRIVLKVRVSLKIYRPSVRHRLSALTWHMFSYTMTNMSPFTILFRVKNMFLLITLIVSLLRTITVLAMRTEQVVSTPPVKLDSVDKLITHEVSFAWHNMYMYSIFKASHDERIKKIIASSEKKGISNLIFTRTIVPEIGTKLLHQLQSQEIAFVIPQQVDYKQAVCRLSIMHQIDLHGSTLIHVSLPQVPHAVVGTVMSASFVRRNRTVSRLVQKSIRISIESDIIRPFEQQVFEMITKSQGMMLDGIGECISEKEELAPVLFRQSYANLANLMHACTVLIVIGMIALVIERCMRVATDKQEIKGRNLYVFLFPRNGRALPAEVNLGYRLVQRLTHFTWNWIPHIFDVHSNEIIH